MRRSQLPVLLRDLAKKMVFLVGPRQSGKTWLAKEIAKTYSHSTYLNYDRYEDREIIRKEAWLANTDLLILDELHKMKGWKNYVKGVFDTKPEWMKILVTGSARLDVFRQAGDSLAGRFFLHHLLPFTPREFEEIREPVDIDRFLKRGGFPEPLLAENDVDADRWRLLYADSLIRHDVLDFNHIHDIRNMQLIFEMLRRRVGSPVSIKSISEDVEIAPNTVKKYFRILEALYIIFSVIPYSKNIARSLLKEPKVYFFDTGLVVGDEGARLENLTAVSLFKEACTRSDESGIPVRLHTLRTKDRREVDFCLVVNDRPEIMIEVKTSDDLVSPGLKYFHARLGLGGIQIVRHLKRERKDGGIEVREAKSLLRMMDWEKNIGSN
jgi:predicted AAA+ superfamily ATPase